MGFCVFSCILLVLINSFFAGFGWKLEKTMKKPAKNIGYLKIKVRLKKNTKKKNSNE